MNAQRNTGRSRPVGPLVRLDVDMTTQGQLLLERSLWTEVKVQDNSAIRALESIRTVALLLKLEVVTYYVASANGQLALVLLPHGMPQPDLLEPVSIPEKFGWRMNR